MVTSWLGEPGNELCGGLGAFLGWLPWLLNEGCSWEFARMHSIARMILLSHPSRTNSNTCCLKDGKILAKISIGFGLFSGSKASNLRLNKLTVWSKSSGWNALLKYVPWFGQRDALFHDSMSPAGSGPLRFFTRGSSTSDWKPNELFSLFARSRLICLWYVPSPSCFPLEK